MQYNAKYKAEALKNGWNKQVMQMRYQLKTQFIMTYNHQTVYAIQNSRSMHKLANTLAFIKLGNSETWKAQKPKTSIQ